MDDCDPEDYERVREWDRQRRLRSQVEVPEAEAVEYLKKLVAQWRENFAALYDCMPGVN